MITLQRNVSLVHAVQLLVCLLFLPACGYRQGSVYRDDITSINIPIFKNRTFYREFEFAMTEATSKAIESRTPYKVLANDLAESQVIVTLKSIQQRKLSQNPINPFGTVPPTDLPLEMEIEATLDIAWHKQEKVLVDQRGVIVNARYRPPYSDNLDEGKQRLAQAVSEKILSLMTSEW